MSTCLSQVSYSHIGTTINGWKSAFVLFSLNDKWTGANGQWYKPRELSGLVMETEKYQSKFLGAHGLVGNLDPQAGQICYKDGAATGRTTGTIGQTEALMFLKGTVDIAFPEQRRLMLTNPNSLRSIRTAGFRCHRANWAFDRQKIQRLYIEKSLPSYILKKTIQKTFQKTFQK